MKHKSVDFIPFKTKDFIESYLTTICNVSNIIIIFQEQYLLFVVIDDHVENNIINLFCFSTDIVCSLQLATNSNNNKEIF